MVAVAALFGCGHDDGSSGRGATVDESASPGDRGAALRSIDSLEDLGPVLGCEVRIAIDATAGGGESVGDLAEDPSTAREELTGMGFDAAYVTLQEHTIQAGRCDTSYALRSLDGDITREQILDGIAASCERAREARPDLDEITEVYAFGRFAQHEEGWWLVQPNSFEEPETLEPLAGDDAERGEYECPGTTPAPAGTATETNDDSNTGPTDEVVEQSGVQVAWAPVSGDSNAVNQELLSDVQGIAREHDGYVEQHGNDVVVRITGTTSDFDRASVPLTELFARQSVEFERQNVSTVEFVMLGDRSGQDGIVAEFPAELTSEDARSICERSVAAGAAACTAGTVTDDAGASGFIELFGTPAAPDAATFVEQYVPQDFVDSDDLLLAAIRLPA